MQLYREWLIAFTSLQQVYVVQNLSGKLTRKINKFKRFDIYKDVAKSSGGWIVEVEKTDTKSSELLTNMTNHHLDGKIFVIEKCSNPKFEFIVEKTAELGYIIVNSRSNMKSVKITSPSGSTKDYAINVNDESLFVGEIKNPPHGLWKANVELQDIKKLYRALVAVKSSLFLSHELYDGEMQLEKSTFLIPGKTYSFYISFIPEIVGAKLSIKLFDEERNELGKEISVNGYLLGFVCPGKAFFVETIGIYSDGSKFQRWDAVIYNISNDSTGKIDETPVKTPEVTGGGIETKKTTATTTTTTRQTTIPKASQRKVKVTKPRNSMGTKTKSTTSTCWNFIIIIITYQLRSS